MMIGIGIIDKLVGWLEIQAEMQMQMQMQMQLFIQ